MPTTTRSLSETKRGSLWLKNFDGNDLETAKLLLSSISVFSEKQFRSEMRELVRKAKTSIGDEPVAAFAVRTLPRKFSPHYYECSTRHEGLRGACPIPELSGSGLLVRHQLEKIARARKLLLEPTVDEMKAKRVRRILLITDTAVSGDEVVHFQKYIHSNPTIRSWHSYGLIRFEIVAHSVTLFALRTLSADQKVHFERLARTIDSCGWSEQQRGAVIELCKRQASSPKDALGWQGAGLLDTYAHTFGNGTPGILRQRTGPGGTTWVPLLPADRNYGLESVHHNEGYSPVLTASERIELVRSTVRSALRPARATRRALVKLEYFSAAEFILIAFLHAVSKGKATPLEIMESASISSSRFHEAARIAHEHGLIKNYQKTILAFEKGPSVKAQEVGRFVLTSAGRRALRRLTIRNEVIGTDPPITASSPTISSRDENATSTRLAGDVVYYPQSLR